MKINDNFSITRLFITKKVTIFLEDKNSFDIQLYSIKDYYENDDLNAIYHLLTTNLKKIQSIYLKQLNSQYDIVTQMIF